jgi:parallel beta helix pectate lyase-like protein
MENQDNHWGYWCLVIVLFLALLSPMSAWAADVQVVCPSGGPGAFSSVTAALSTLNRQGPNSITVSGTCTENIFVDKYENLIVQAVPGQTATVAAADSTGIVLQIFASTGIILSDLVFQGGATGVLVNQGANVNIFNCTMRQNSGDGLGVQIGSTAVVENSTMQNNGGNGMSISAQSNVTLATFPDQRIRVQGNSGDGIDVDGSYLQVNFGTLSVENNAGAALLAFGSRLLIFGGSPGDGNLLQNNGEGVDVFNAASAQFFGKNTIRGNGDVGLQVLGSSVAINGSGSNVTVIEGHATLGVNIVRLGEVFFGGPHKIQNNGNPSADPTLRGGIRVVRGSLTLNRNPEVSGNVGPGVRAEQNSGLSFGVAATTIANNTENGVQVTLQSEAAFPTTPVFSGNGGATISCDTTSLISGQLAGIPNIDCKQITRAQGPPRPGRIVQ